jgi:hypothetical protein
VDVDKLTEHVRALRVTVMGLPDPPPSDAIDLFNKFLDVARLCKGPRSLAHEIPDQGPDASRAEIILWANQLLVALSPRNI